MIYARSVEGYGELGSNIGWLSAPVGRGDDMHGPQFDPPVKGSFLV